MRRGPRMAKLRFEPTEPKRGNASSERGTWERGRFLRTRLSVCTLLRRILGRLVCSRVAVAFAAGQRIMAGTGQLEVMVRDEKEK